MQQCREITKRNITILVDAGVSEACGRICAFFQGRQAVNGDIPTADCTRYDLSPAWVNKPETGHFQRLAACQKEFGNMRKEEDETVESPTFQVYPPAQPGGEGPGTQPEKKRAQ